MSILFILTEGFCFFLDDEYTINLFTITQQLCTLGWTNFFILEKKEKCTNCEHL